MTFRCPCLQGPLGDWPPVTNLPRAAGVTWIGLALVQLTDTSGGSEWWEPPPTFFSKEEGATVERVPRTLQSQVLPSWRHSEQCLAQPHSAFPFPPSLLLWEVLRTKPRTFCRQTFYNCSFMNDRGTTQKPHIMLHIFLPRERVYRQEVARKKMWPFSLRGPSP